MSPIRRAMVGSATGLLAGAVIGPILGIVGFLAFHVYLNLTTENPSPESLGPLYSVTVGAAMGLVVGIPTGLVVGAVIGVIGMFTSARSVNIKAIVVGVLSGTLTCAALLAVGFFFPPLGTASVIVGGAFTIGVGALAGVSAGVFVARIGGDRFA